MKAKDIVHAAARAIGVLAADENLTDAELQDALESLRDLLADWATSKLFVYAAKQVIIPLNPAQSVYTVGAGGDIAETLTQISDSAVLTVAGCDKAIKLRRDTNETQPYHHPVSYSIGVGLWNFVIEDTQATKLEITAYDLPQTLTALTELELPTNYKRALKYALAIEMAPEYEKSVSADLRNLASTSMNTLKRANSTPSYAKPDQTLMNIGRRCGRGFYR